MTVEPASFLARWSRRKAGARDGAPAVAPAPEAAAAARPAAAADIAPTAPAEPAAEAAAPAVAAPAPAPTLDDVAALTPESDFARFVAADVGPEVKNAALKKLFTDPQFNVMDGLDTYIGDYNTPDPLPAGMLRQMVQSHLLGLFDDELKDAAAPAAGAPAATATDPAPAPEAPSPTEPACHENADLQLQPDDDAGRAGPAPGPGADPGCQH